jgi:hypothetical protein
VIFFFLLATLEKQDAAQKELIVLLLPNVPNQLNPLIKIGL